MSAALNPYDTLGVDQGASAAEIRAAYRRLAKVAHPDAGGDARGFARLHTAHLVLIDPVRRKRFDETGTIDDAPDNLEQQANSFIMRMLVSTLEQDDDPASVDLVAAMKEYVANDMASTNRLSEKNKKAAVRAERIAERFAKKHKGGNNTIALMLKQHAVALRQQEHAFERQREVLRRVAVILNDYRFSPEQQVHVFTWSGGGSSTLG